MNDLDFPVFRAFPKINIPAILAVSSDWGPSEFRVFLCNASLAIDGVIADDVSITRTTCDILGISEKTLKRSYVELSKANVILERRRGYIAMNGYFTYKGTEISGHHPFEPIEMTPKIDERMREYYFALNRQYTRAFHVPTSEVVMEEFRRNTNFWAYFMPVSEHEKILKAALREKEMLIDDIREDSRRQREYWEKEHEKREKEHQRFMEVQDAHMRLIEQMRAELTKHDPEKAEVIMLKLVKGGKSAAASDKSELH